MCTLIRQYGLTLSTQYFPHKRAVPFGPSMVLDSSAKHNIGVATWRLTHCPSEGMDRVLLDGGRWLLNIGNVHILILKGKLRHLHLTQTQGARTTGGVADLGRRPLCTWSAPCKGTPCWARPGRHAHSRAKAVVTQIDGAVSSRRLLQSRSGSVSHPIALILVAATCEAVCRAGCLCSRAHPIVTKVDGAVTARGLMQPCCRPVRYAIALVLVAAAGESI